MGVWGGFGDEREAPAGSGEPVWSLSSGRERAGRAGFEAIVRRCDREGERRARREMMCESSDLQAAARRNRGEAKKKYFFYIYIFKI